MKSIKCNIIKAGRGDVYGRPFAIGQIYTGPFDYVRQLVSCGYATVDDAAVFDDDSTPQNSEIAIVGKGRMAVEAELNEVTGEVEYFSVGIKKIGVGSTYTWATKPLPSALTGQIFISDVGVGGSYWYSDGSKWRPVGGRVVLKNTIVDITHSTIVKTVMDYAVLLAGLVQDGDILSVMALKERTGGTSDTESTDIMIGAAATAPGTSVGLGTGVLATTTIQYSVTWSMRKESPTTIRPMSVTGSTGSGANASPNAVVTVPNMGTQTTYLQITSVLALGAGEVAHLRGFTVTLVCGS